MIGIIGIIGITGIIESKEYIFIIVKQAVLHLMKMMLRICIEYMLHN